MANPIQSPLDVGPFPEQIRPPVGNEWNDLLAIQVAPPIIPNVTELGPEKQRALQQALLAGQPMQDAYDDEQGEGDDDMDYDEMAPEELMVCAAKIGVAAAKVGMGLPGVLCQIIKSTQQGMLMGGGGVGQAPGMEPGILPVDSTFMPPPMVPMGSPPPVPASPMPPM